MTEKEQAIADELKAVLKKHDMAGACFFCDRTSGHYVYEFSPSWSCITMSPDGEVRMRAMRADFASPDAQVKAVYESSEILFFLRHVASRLIEDCEKILVLISGNVPFPLRSRMRDRKDG